MRIFCFATFCLFIALRTPAQVKKQTLESNITKVTVFIEGSQVERHARANLTTGKHELIFHTISPNIEKQSIQVKAEGNLTVLAVTHQQNFLKEQEQQVEIKVLEDKKELILSTMAKEKNLLLVYKQEEGMMIKNQQVGGNNGFKAADLKEAADLQRNRLIEIYQKQMEIEKRIKKIEIELKKIILQLAELNKRSDQSTGEIVVTVHVKQTAMATFHVSYLVKTSGWYPTYDIRVTDISNPLNLQYKANVFQNSGED